MSGKPQCTNTYLWFLGKGLRYYAKPHLRQPAPGEPDVPDLVRPGDWIRSSYHTEGLVVRLIRVPYGIAGQSVVTWTINFLYRYQISQKRQPEFCIYNDVVACGGRLMSLFEANTTTYEVSKPPDDLPPYPRWLRNLLTQQKQLSLFEV